MDDKPHIRSVDSHPKCYGGHDDLDFLVDEGVLCPHALFGSHARVVSDDRVTGVVQRLSKLIHIGAPQAVNDPPGGLPRGASMPIDDLLALCQYIGLRYDSIGQVRAIKGTDRNLGRAQLKLFENVASDPLGSRRRQRHDRSLGKVFSKLEELSVLWAKVVPPLRYAVGFVDGDHPDVVSLEEFGKIFLQCSLGGSEKKSDLLLA